MNTKCEEITTEVKEKIALRKEVKKFRADKRTSEYTHTRATLGLTSLYYKMTIRRLLTDRRLMRQGKTLEVREKADWRQFDTCSYAELTSCIKGRIRWIRESVKVLENTALGESYQLITERVKQRIEDDQREIKKLLKMRRILKHSRLRNWNSDIMTVG